MPSGPIHLSAAITELPFIVLRRTDLAPLQCRRDIRQFRSQSRKIHLEPLENVLGCERKRAKSCMRRLTRRGKEGPTWKRRQARVAGQPLLLNGALEVRPDRRPIWALLFGKCLNRPLANEAGAAVSRGGYLRPRDCGQVCCAACARTHRAPLRSVGRLPLNAEYGRNPL